MTFRQTGYDGKDLGRFILVLKDFFNGQAKKAGDPESRGQAGVKLLLFNGINSLAGNPYFGCQVFLSPLLFSPQNPYSVLHRGFFRG